MKRKWEKQGNIHEKWKVMVQKKWKNEEKVEL